MTTDHFEQSLRDAFYLCEGMVEAQPMCEQVRQRIAAIAEMVADSSAPQCEVIKPTLIDKITEFNAFLGRTTRRQTVFRIASSRTVEEKCLQVHLDLDALLGTIEIPEAYTKTVASWRNQYEDALQTQRAAYNALSQDRIAMMRELRDERDQAEALTLIMYEHKRSDGGYTEAGLKTLSNAFSTIARFSRAQVPAVPKLFVPFYEAP
uniref:Uncharacterized protein n=1 Tax=Globisporangium ultimum (strain ATCC 200006 / CBS 805.95 / DAOM BR144) TaxID=431595 RepID=K3X775_GLOUD